MSSLAKKILQNVMIREPEVAAPAISPALRAGRAHSQGYKTEAYRGAHMPLDLSKDRDIRWFAKDAPVAETYMPDLNSDFYNENSSYAKEISPQMTKVKLKLGRSLQVDAGGETWGSLSAGMIKEKKFQELLKKAGYSQGIETNEIANLARKNGYDSVTFKNMKDHKFGNNNNTPNTTVYAVFKPQHIRGHLAAFDPKNKDVANLLAGVLASGGTAAMLGAGQKNEGPV